MRPRGNRDTGSQFWRIHDTGPKNTPAEDVEEIDEGRQPITVEQLVQQIKETADKLVRDNTNRGDVKLLSTALKELRYAFKVFQPFRKQRKVTIFGSARIKPEHPSYQQAVEFGRRCADEGFMVITGAASGIMEAGHVGAGRENSMGVNILLPFEQDANAVIAGDRKLMHLKYFFTRKLLFVKESDAVALFPGGFGTLDEGFEVLTLIQTGKSHIFPIVLVDEPGGNYWKKWQEFIRELLLERGMISPEDMSLFKVTDSVDAAIDEIVNFYKVYHSMRYVKRDLVFRLQKQLPEKLMTKIRSEFKDLLVSGSFEQVAALPEEANDQHLAHLPRLRFHFDRRSLGRLRQLIDTINAEE
ncbi:MAG: TIGR00730 family Rossman fold protein [Gemmataceae bacterium]